MIKSYVVNWKKIGAGILSFILCFTAVGVGTQIQVKDQGSALPTDFVEYIDPILGIQGIEEETPLASEPTVTTSTNTKTTKTIEMLSKKSTSTYVVVHPKETSTQTATASTSTATVKTKIKIVKTVKDKYKKNSKQKVVTTKVKTTVTKTSTPIESGTTAASAINTSSKVNIRSIAPKAPENILHAFEALSFKVVVDSSLQYSGLTSAKSQQIALNNTNGTTIYHELGHFLALLAGYPDDGDAFIAIYNKEKDKLTRGYAEYHTSSSREYFAESFLEYIFYNAELRTNRPETYAFLEQCINMVTEQRIQLYKTTYASIWTYDN